MRPAVLAMLLLGLPALTAALAVSGKSLRAGLPAPEAVNQAKAAPTPPSVVEDRSSRLVVAAGIVPPNLGAGPIERIEARTPLGELGLAAPPRRKQRGPLLHRPVAVESAVIEAGGRRIAIAGALSLAPEQVCDVEGMSWPCGARARTALRLWLRGRALECDLPKEPGEGDVVAPCRLAGQDAGRWLVANGWARAAPGGPYEEAERTARESRKGMFGPPPGAADAMPPADPPAPYR